MRTIPAAVLSGLFPLAATGASAPCEPELIGSTALSLPGGIAVEGALAYVAANGLRVVDVSDPANMTVIGTIGSGSGPGIALAGSLVYLPAGSDGLHIIDVSDPSNPALVNTFNMQAIVAGIAISGNTAYTKTGAFNQDTTVHVLDISDPANPAVVGSVQTPGQSVMVEHADNIVYVPSLSAGLHLVDVSNPAAPALVSTVPAAEAAWVYVEGPLVYLSDGDAGLKVIDVTNPAAPSIIGSVDTPGFANGIVVEDSLAYVADFSGLTVVDVSDPTTPVVAGSVQTKGSFTLRVALSGSLAFVTDFESGLESINVESCQPTAIPGDITGDGVVNVNDLLAVINAWGPCPAPPQSCPADIAPGPNGDGVVNVNDLLMVINNWG